MPMTKQTLADLREMAQELIQRIDAVEFGEGHCPDTSAQTGALRRHSMEMTRSAPVRVQAIGARLSDEIASDMYNYGQLQVVFEDGSVGWYEAGWGPMMSETAFFVKDVVGPKGCVSIVESEKVGKSDSADIDSHTQTNCLRRHEAELDSDGGFARDDAIIDTSDEPDHQELCNREQAYFLKSIKEDLDLSEHLEDAVNSLRIVLAADESVRTGRVVDL